LILPAAKRKSVRMLVPLFGTIIFAALYIVATVLYPGGSQVDKTSVGFSWVNNYWCNLLNENAINGQPNPAKAVAITGMVVLCFTLTFFWFLFSRHIEMDRVLRLVIQISGTLAMAIAFFLFSSINHDVITNLASLFGVIATIGVYVGLYKVRWLRLFAFGLFNILLVLANNYVYHTEGLIVYLPVLQKITFAYFLTWICCIDITLFSTIQKYRHQQKKEKISRSC
jgi:predicted neutral ceramidase superfamily lipid hydrolase